MKKFILAITLLLLCSPAWALIVTDNVDKDSFGYEVAYQFATNDLGASYTANNMPIRASASIADNFYVVPRDGYILGLSVAGNVACTAGAATFDVTINEQVTGIQAVIEDRIGTVDRTAVGTSGAAGERWAYIWQPRGQDVTSQGFRGSGGVGCLADLYNNEHPYGKATPLTAGNRIGVKVTTSSGFTPTAADYIVVIYALH